MHGLRRDSFRRFSDLLNCPGEKSRYEHRRSPAGNVPGARNLDLATSLLPTTCVKVSGGCGDGRHECLRHVGAALLHLSITSPTTLPWEEHRSTMKTSLDKAKIKILLLEGIHQSALEALKEDGYSNVECHAKSLAEPELVAAIRNAYFVGIRSATQLTRPILEQAPRLIGVGCFCIGTNQVDLEAAQERGIPVFNAPFSNTRSVAELVLAEIIMLLRGIPHRNAQAHRGAWVKTATGSYEVRGKCLGIVGYGRIGTQVGLLAESLGMRVIYHDVENKL